MPPSVDASKRILGYRVPRGVVGVITPWNWPYTMPAELLAPALAAGNAVVWSPASSTSICAVKLAECIVDAELPAGVFSMVTGRGAVVGDEIAGSPGTHAIGFIGSVETGLKVATRAAGKAMVLELGGNGPMIVLEDADVGRGGRGEPRRLVPLRRPELHGRRAVPRPRVRPRRVRRAPAGGGRARDPARRPAAGRDDDGAAEQRVDRGEDGPARRGRARPRRRARRRRRPRRGLPDRALLAGDRPRPRHRGDGGRARGDVRAGDPDHDDRERRRGAADRERVSRTGCSPRSGRATWPVACASPRPSTPAG